MVTSVIINSIRKIFTPIFKFTINEIRCDPVSGGSINSTYQVTINQHQRFFCKVNSNAKFHLLFENEKTGLELLRSQKIFRIPEVIVCDVVDGLQLLILEWIEHGQQTTGCWKKAGRQLAQLHQVTHSQFGFASNNYMGALPQSNSFNDKWTAFFVEQRLMPQVDLAAKNNLISSSKIMQFEKLYQRMDDIFAQEKPSLLHGDLWNGNIFADEAGNPILVDPAVYYGHRSIDLAMTTLFGGFGPAFYEAYHYHFPLPANHRQQWDICNLYPLLVHLNLFGKSYLAGILRIIDRY